MDKDTKLIIHLVETPQGCFITDCIKTSGYYYEYHQSKIEHLYFDGQKADPTFAKNWMRIKQFPKTVEQVIPGKQINIRYELKEIDIASEKLPISIAYENRGNYSDDVIESLYSYQYDILPDTTEVADVEIIVVLKMTEYAEPSLKYEAVETVEWNERVYTITSKHAGHQLIDGLVFPEICLAHRPCSLSSKQVYDITRQYVLTHIDSTAAKVTSNYGHCFTVKKIIPKTEPETVIYHSVFARTKKERNKIRTAVNSYTEYEIFQMTHNEANREGYLAIPSIFAKNEAELQEKMDEWLSTLMGIINMPLQECSHCKGTGLLGEVQKVSHKTLKEISGKHTDAAPARSET